MDIIIPKSPDDMKIDPGPWYVVKSDTYNFGHELAADLKPMFRGKTLEECKFYIADQMRHDQARGYELFAVDTKHSYLVILKYQPTGLITLGANQFICYAAYSKRQAEAMKFVKADE